MKLETFDLQAAINKDNKKRKRGLSPGSDFGFPYFKAEQLGAINELITQLNQAQGLFLFNETEHQSLSNTKKQLRQLQLALKQKQQPLNRVKADPGLRKKISQKESFYLWQTQLRHRFGQKGFWQSDKRAMTRLQKDWDSCGLFQGYNPKALRFAATTILPAIETQSKAALKKLKWYFFRIPRSVYKSYKRHLNDNIYCLRELKKALAHTLAKRSFGEFRYGQPDMRKEGASQHQRYVWGFASVDFAFVVRVVLSLMVIFLAYNSISEERTQGTLKLALANALPRGQLLFGKFLGGLFVILGSLTIAVLIAVLVMVLHPAISLDRELFVRILGMWGVSALYLGTFFTLSLMVSTIINRPSVALLVLLQIWIVVIVKGLETDYLLSAVVAWCK